MPFAYGDFGADALMAPTQKKPSKADCSFGASVCSSLGARTPDQMYFDNLPLAVAA